MLASIRRRARRVSRRASIAAARSVYCRTIMAELDHDLARVLTRVMPEFVSLERCARLSGGASQETYAVDILTRDGPRRLALRRAPGGEIDARDYGGPGLAVEARLMTLARDAGVPAPEIVHVLDSGDGLGDGFVMEWLEGETLGARIVKAQEFAEVRQRLAYQCGEILARIHAIDVEAHGLTEHLERLTPAAFVERQWQYYRKLGTPQPMIDFTARWLLEHLPPARPLTLVHNDFRNGNLMISPGAGVIGVLDWEVAHIGDPMRDLGWICTNSWRFGQSQWPVGGFGRREDLFAGYQAVSGQPVDAEHVRFWEVFGSFWWAVGALIMGDHYRHGADRSVERPAIGRRSSECQVDCVNLIMPGKVELPAAAPFSGDELPRNDELLVSVRDFLREDVMAATSGRTHFMARVAANSLDILLRDLQLGPALRAIEQRGLVAVLGHDGEREALRWELKGVRIRLGVGLKLIMQCAAPL
jgi:aminoglycoside phosphotransferase (APT) family kinase protein